MTSLGPMTAAEAARWLAEEYGADEARDRAIRAFEMTNGSILEV